MLDGKFFSIAHIVCSSLQFCLLITGPFWSCTAAGEKEIVNKEIVIKAAGQFSVALVESKRMYSWGSNQFGQDSTLVLNLLALLVQKYKY
jgi:hypothetical protein